MIKFKKIDSDIFKFIEQLPTVFENERKICLAYLFGSLAVNKINDLSDVDIAYLFRGYLKDLKVLYCSPLSI